VRIAVREFQWDDENIEHLAGHGLYVDQVYHILYGNPLFFPNKKRRTGTHKIIGPDLSDVLWTIVIVRVGAGGLWRCITGWTSDDAEEALFRAARQTLHA
jgi:hypothetical protein